MGPGWEHNHSISPELLDPTYVVPGMPRIIWMLWLQGWQETPYVVRMAAESWVKLNPEWRVMLLIESSLPHFVDLPPSFHQHGPAHKADIARLALLSRWGGLWVDAT